MTDDPEKLVLDTVAALGLEYERVACDPEHADTAVFCETYGYPLEIAANAIIVASKKKPRVFACCVVLGTRRLDVNGRVRKLMGVRRLSFARPDDMRALTGMEVGGVTPFALPADLPLYIDGAMTGLPRVIVGTGGRKSKLLIDPGALAALPGAQVVDDLSRPRAE